MAVGWDARFAKRLAARLAPLVLILTALTWLWMRFNTAPGQGNRAARRIAVMGDLLNYYFGMTEQTASRLAAGELPLWNPHACAGIPHLATLQVGVFYPATWAALVLPTEVALPLVLFAQCALAGWFCFLLFRAWGREPLAAAFGGILFVFACMLGATFWPPFVATALWLPWLVLCVDRISDGGSFRWWAGLAVGTALQVLAGLPQILVYSFALLGPYALVRLIDARGEASLGEVTRRAAALVAAILLGLGLASVQLFPTVELVEESARGGELSPEEVHYLSRYGGHRVGGVLRRALDPSPKLVSLDYGNGGGFLGLPTLVMIALGLVAGARERRTWLLLGVGIAALLLSDGYRGWARPVYELYASTPLVGGFRSPERLRLLTFFCAIAIAVTGFDRLVRPEPEPDRRRRLQGVLIAAVIATAAGLWAVGHLGYAWRLGALLLLGWVLIQTARPRWLRRSALAALTLLVLVDLAGGTGAFGSLRELPLRLVRYYHAGGGRPVPEPVVAALRTQAGLSRAELVGFKPHVAANPSRGLYRLACYEPLVPARWAELSERLETDSKLGRTMWAIDPAEYPLVYDATSVVRIVRPTRKGAAVVANNHDALPRAYLVEGFQVASVEETLERLAAGSLDLRRRVALESDPGLAPVQDPGAPVPADIRAYAPERVEIAVDAPRDAFLVLTDTHYPGWEARVDDSPVEILRANGLFRAVRVAAGRHQVVFEYRPASLRWGAVLSLLSVALLVALGVASRRRAARATPRGRRG